MTPRVFLLCSSLVHLDAQRYWIPPSATSLGLTFHNQHFPEEMYSFKTLIQALLVASVASSTLAIVIPDINEIHAERALLLGPGLTQGLERIGLKALVTSDIKKTVADVQQVIKNVTNSVREFDLDGSPDVA